MKRKLIIIWLSFYALGATNQDRLFIQAKSLLFEGKRKDAVILLKGTGRSSILAEQFITAENFQRYQDLRAFADAELWPECLKHTSLISSHDQDNVLVLRLKGHCQIRANLFDEATKTFSEILTFNGADPGALIGLASIALERRQILEGLKALEGLDKSPLKSATDAQKLAIVWSRLLEEKGDFEGAIQKLTYDQEKHLDHIEVIFKLAQLYQRHPGFDWQALRYYSLFVSRCKKLLQSKIALNHLEPALLESQSALIALEKKLAVDPTRTQ